MRLTLRTLLAYMDDILEPEDAQEIGKKIAESPVATELMHRIRDVMRRLRLGAPSVLDRGAGLDPNTVAEYLDNTLSDAQVPDFEKVCLESDVQLAEVASCHRILALVLGEPAEVDPVSRQRAYQLPDQLAAQSPPEGQVSELATVGLGPRPPGPEGGPAVPSARSRLPEYLRQYSLGRRIWRPVPVLAAVIAIGLVALALWGRLGQNNLLARLFGRQSPLALEQTAPPSTSLPEIPAPEAVSEGVKQPGHAEPSEVSPDRPLAPEDRQPVGTGGRSGPAAGAVPPPEGAAAGPWGPTARDRTTKKSEPAGPSRPPQTKPPSAHAAPPAKPLPAETPAADRPLAQPAGAVVPDARPEPAPGIKPPVGPPEPAPAQPVGQVISSGQALLRFNPRSATWEGVDQQDTVYSGDRLIGLPAFRSVVALGGQVKLELVEAGIELLPPDAQGLPSIAIHHGRLILRPDRATGGRLRVWVGDRTGVVSFHDAESMLAIEARRRDAQGADPETQPGPMIAELYVPTGKIGWQEQSDPQQVTLEAPDRRIWGGAGEGAKAAQQFPRWVYSDTSSPLDQRGAAVLQRALRPARPANLILRELAEDRRKEVRWLAIRSLALIGDFELLARPLDGPDQQLGWDNCIEHLRAGVMRGPASAAAVRTAMERLYGAEGSSLYEMLWRYQPQAVQPADLQHLADWLNHESLAMRVLAAWNLRTLTRASFPYRPDDPPAKRQVAAQRWKERLKAGPIPRGDSPSGGSRGVEPGSGVPPDGKQAGQLR
ncbi:MAG: hypothetical protein ACUVUC_09380 [Thermoguttaceae bacterium]